MIPFPKIPSPAADQIDFCAEDIDFELADSEVVADWIRRTIREESKVLDSIQFVFCNDARLLQINIEYLDHDTLTDIITFPYGEEYIEGDIYISIDRIRENADTFGVTFEQELHRVIIHGVLHLCGYGDKTPEEKNTMTGKENDYLGRLPAI
jgi:probable rRNA maturation factor